MNIEGLQARAALLLMRAGLPGIPISAPVLLMPEGRQLSLGAAALALEALEKPIQCIAHLEKGRMVVSLTNTMDPSSIELHQNQLLLLSQQRGAIGSLTKGEHLHDTVGLEGAGGFMLLPVAVLQSVMRDYVIAMPLALGRRNATAKELEQGISEVVTASKVRSLDDKEVQEWLSKLPRVDR